MKSLAPALLALTLASCSGPSDPVLQLKDSRPEALEALMHDGAWAKIQRYLDGVVGATCDSVNFVILDPGGKKYFDHFELSFPVKFMSLGGEGAENTVYQPCLDALQIELNGMYAQLKHQLSQDAATAGNR